MTDEELPGMWESADLSGGWADSQNSWASPEGPRCACGNRFDGDNLCMPSACQWEGIESPRSPEGPDEGLREQIESARSSLLLAMIHTSDEGSHFLRDAYDRLGSVLPLLTAERERGTMQAAEIEQYVGERLAEARRETAEARERADALQRQVDAAHTAAVQVERRLFAATQDAASDVMRGALVEEALRLSRQVVEATRKHKARAALSRTATEEADRD